MEGLTQDSKKKGLSRRRFVQGSALAAAALALQGCSNNNNLAETEETVPVTGGEWMPVVCNMHCMGKCALKAYMVDGMPVRLKTDDTHEDTPDYPQRRACQLGRSRLYDNFGPTRLKYPMKRKSWQPGGGENSHGELRGIDEWEQVTWEDALDLIADEMVRIRDTYGNKSILGLAPRKAEKWSEKSVLSPDTSNRHGWSFMNVLNLFGGFTTAWGTWSNGAFVWSDSLYGFSGRDANDRMDSRTSDYAVVFGCNPVVSADGGAIHVQLRPMVDAGVKFYFMDPMFNDSIAALGNEGVEWVPIRPGTDKAMLLAMAYVMLTEDNPATNPLIDWEFLEKYTIGYDADHMPEGANPEDNFKDYALGTYDGMPKTPEWASNICGVPADKIHEIALVMGKNNKVGLHIGCAGARTNEAEAYTQIGMIVGAMGGHIGKSGHSVAGDTPGGIFYGGSLVRSGPFPLLELDNPVTDSIHEDDMWQALLAKRYHYTGCNQKFPYEDREIDVKMVYSFVMNVTHHTVNMPKAVEFYRTVDLFVCHQMTLSDTARYADFVLPTLTPWEIAPQMHTRTDYATLGLKMCDPIFETRSYQWIGAELLTRWGLDPKDAFPSDEVEQNFSIIYGTEIRTEDGKGWEPLLSFTAEEAALFGPYAEPRAEGRISYTEMSKIGIYTIERKPGDQYTSFGMSAFINDPVENPRSTESGKLEFYSQRANTLSKQVGYSELSPLPKYVPTTNGYESTFSDFEAGVKGDTPYQLFSPHYQRCKHSHFDTLDIVREGFQRPIFISTADADEKGVKDGDTVRVFNENGSVLRPAYVTNRLMPGVVALPHGGQCLVDEASGYNIAGSDNWLTYSVSTGMGASAYNSQRCNFEKHSTQQPADIDVPNPTPEFQRVEYK